ncbi:MAG: metallophosphoesterase [Sedimentisphaeraceae bacterium JB056]
MKKQDVPLYVISDLHLGFGRRDSFNEPARIRQLFSFVDHIEKENGQLVILGDFFDLWRFRLSSIVKTHPDIIQRFSELDCVYVPGNHDRAVLNVSKTLKDKYGIFNKISEPFSVNIKDKKIIFCHGHEVDTLNKFIRPSFGKILGHFAIIVEHFAKRQIFDSDNIRSAIFEAEASIASAWSTMILGINKFITESMTIQKLAVEMLKHKHNIKTINRYKKHLDQEHIVINAHTHKAGYFKDCYYNSGAWSMGNSDFIRISPNGMIDVLKWENTGIKKNLTLLA